MSTIDLVILGMMLEKPQSTYDKKRKKPNIEGDNIVFFLASFYLMILCKVI